MTYVSPAMRTLHEAVESQCKLPELQKFRDQSLLFVEMLKDLVNPTATMSEEQAQPLADYIADKYVPSGNDFPPLPLRLTFATYMNTCRP